MQRNTCSCWRTRQSDEYPLFSGQLTILCGTAVEGRITSLVLVVLAGGDDL
jgi:hypothetical protein